MTQEDIFNENLDIYPDNQNKHALFPGNEFIGSKRLVSRQQSYALSVCNYELYGNKLLVYLYAFLSDADMQTVMSYFGQYGQIGQ